MTNEPAASPRRKAGWRELSLVLVFLAIGLAARTHQIGYNFDFDELSTITQRISGSFAQMIPRALIDHAHPPFYYILLHFWVAAFGPSETSARMLSVCLSAIFLMTAYALFRRLMPPRAALGSLAILAVSQYFIYYDQEARPYALISLLATTNMLAFTRLLESPADRRRTLLWAATCAMLIYSQYLGGLIIAIEIGFALLLLRTNRFKIALFGLAATVLIAPWIIAAMYQPLASGADPLQQLDWMAQRPKAADFTAFYINIFGFIPKLRSILVMGVVLLAGAWFVWKRFRSRGLRLDHLFLFAIALGMPVVVYAESKWGPRPIFAERQMIGAAIAFVGLIGLFAASLRKGLDIVFFVVLIAWTAAAMPQAFPQSSKPPWRQVASDLNQRFGSEPVVVLEPWVAEPLDFYRGGHRVQLWDNLSEKQKAAGALLVCRPFLNSAPDLTARIQPAPLATWHWGWLSKPSQSDQLNVYEIAPAAQASLR
jgi:4-amino-4-deoxy-L-arabinose transferase-like glycosyltransferase